MKESRLGEIRYNKFGTPMKIIRYVNAGDVTVEFQDKHQYTVNTTYSNFQKGIKNPYDKSIYGIACIGVGKYFSFIDNMITDEYSIWNAILQRCYDEKTRYKSKSYEGCSVCKEWFNFQNFAEWYHKNYYGTKDGKRMHIDKDILVNGNKVYSPNTCMFVPQRINMMFLSKTKNRDADLPNAIYRCVGGFQASYNGKSLGVFKTLEEAINEHDLKKRIHIREVLKEYEEIMPQHVYNAILSW